MQSSNRQTTKQTEVLNNDYSAQNMDIVLLTLKKKRGEKLQFQKTRLQRINMPVNDSTPITHTSYPFHKLHHLNIRWLLFNMNRHADITVLTPHTHTHTKTPTQNTNREGVQ